MDDALRQTWNTVATFVPKLVAFLVILIVGWIIAKVLAKAINAILERVGFDRAVERGGVKKALAKSKYDASDVVGKLVYYALLLFVLQAAFGVFGPNPISTLLTHDRVRHLRPDDGRGHDALGGAAARRDGEGPDGPGPPAQARRHRAAAGHRAREP